MDLIVKPTQRCNFQCSYCSSTEIAKSNGPQDDLELKKIFQFLQRFPQTNSIIFNGGDPLLMPPSYYQEILIYINENKLETKLHFCTNLWDYYLHPHKWFDLFSSPRVSVGTSFDLFPARKIAHNLYLTKELFLLIIEKFKKDFSYIPHFISVINEENEEYAEATVQFAKELGVECKLNYAFASGRQLKSYPIGKMYNIYLDLYVKDLTTFEFNTKQMIKRLKYSDQTICPQNRKCDEGIRNLQPISSSGYEYGSCGAMGDDQEYGIDFSSEMKGEFYRPLQQSRDIQYLKEECLSCPNYNICNGCYKTVKDLKVSDQIEVSCLAMKEFRVKASALGLL